MSFGSDMSVKVQLPTRTLFEGRSKKLIAVAPNGAFGIWPNHVDFVTAIVPSVLALTLDDNTEAFFGLDEGILLKTGGAVTVSVRRGVRGSDLDTLHQTVEASFIQMDEDERQARSALSRLEADMVRRFTELQRPTL